MHLILHRGAETDITTAGDWYEARRRGLAQTFAAVAIAHTSRHPQYWIKRLEETRR